MAKSTKAQQVLTGTPDSYTPEELADPTPPIQITRAMLGVVPEEVAPSVGMDSSPSSKNENLKSDNESQSLQPPVQMTENPSGQPERETDSTAALTVGVGQTLQEPPPFDEELEGFDEDEESDEDEELDEEPEEDKETPEPKSTKKVAPAKKAASKKKANVRSTGDDFDF